MRIGIPRALMFYRYQYLWLPFFESLGLEPLVSPETNAEILRLGLKTSEEEFCLPVKVFFGHVSWLSRKVDTIFVPRMISLERRTTTCPKLIALPDLLRYLPIDLPPLLSPRVSANLGGMKGALYRVGFRLSSHPLRVWRAYHAGASSFRASNNRHPTSGSGLRIGIVGHPYNLYDRYMTQSLLDRLAREHTLLFPGDGNENGSRSPATHLLYWIYERELYQSFHSFLSKQVDGIINVVSFGCGPDSLVSELMLRDSKTHSVPYLQLVLDEHTTEEALQTRVEAFVEMMKRRR